MKLVDEAKQVNEEEIRNAFKKANLPIDKIAKSKLGGFYVYTPFAPSDSYIKYTTVERGEGYVKKLRERIKVNRCFIDDENLLEMAIVEAKTRQKYH